MSSYRCQVQFFREQASVIQVLFSISFFDEAARLPVYFHFKTYNFRIFRVKDTHVLYAFY